MIPRPCLGCGRPTHRTRCAPCQAEHERRRGSASQRGYGYDWQRVRLLVLERDRHRCCWCGGLATTVDHLVPLVDGGSRLDPSNLVACV